MPKARSCPHCKKFLKDHDYSIDNDFNVICNHCNGFVFRAKESKESKEFNPINDFSEKFNANKI